MNSPASRKRLLIVAGSAGLLAAIYFGWFYGGTGGEAPTPPPAPSQQPEVVRDRDNPSAPRPPTQAPGPPAIPGETTADDGAMAIHDILSSDKEHPVMARDLSALVQKLTGEAQVDASRHLVNLCSDEDYGLIAGFLVDHKTNPEVIEVLFADLMNRDRQLQLPLFLNILRNPLHPQNEQVRNVMTILAGEDFGNNYPAWDKWMIEELRRLKAES